jgi:predicted nucleic acid-binding protein
MTEGQARKFVLDSNIYDKIVATEGMIELLEQLHACKTIEIIKTHIQDDELDRIADMHKRRSVKAIPGELVETEGAVFAVSRFDMCTYGEGTGDVKIPDVQKGKPKHSRDALIATTAAVKADILVTEDERLAKRVRAVVPSIDVWGFDQFKAHVYSLKR